MKKTIFISIIFIFIKTYSFYSQTTDSNEVSNFKNLAQENIFVHQNSSFLLSGEVLYYKIYCLNNNTNNLSNLSKIAYIELVSKENSSVFKQKVKLKDGLGQGDLKISKNIPSGNYKLISYTQNMKNFEPNNFFQSDIVIVNPYLNEQSSLINNKDYDQISNNSNKKKELKKISYSNFTSNNNYVDLHINNHLFKPRDKVLLNIKSLKGELSNGDYSISVRKIDTIKIPKKNTSTSIINSTPKNTLVNKTKNSTFYLPELRGELITGKVLFKDTRLPNPNTKVSLSIPGRNPVFKIATTNKEGIFYFNLFEEYENPNAIIQILDIPTDNLSLEINQHEPINLKNINFYNFKLTPAVKDFILNKHIYNQIENVYSYAKPDTFKKVHFSNLLFNSKAKVYNLNDYNRFPTIKETVIEIIKEVYIKRKNGNSSFHIKLYNQIYESNLLPLVLVDGIQIQNHNELLNLSVKSINKISVVSDKFLYDSKPFDGIISIETFNGNYQVNMAGTHIQNIALSKSTQIKNYYNQTYDSSNKYDRIPDYRSQLLWEPNFTKNKKEQTIIFFTSDNCGDYEICLEGFTNEGHPVSLRRTIKIEE